MFFVIHTNGDVSTNVNKPSDLNVPALVNHYYNDLNDVATIHGFATDRDLLIFQRSGREIEFDAESAELVEFTRATFTTPEDGSEPVELTPRTEFKRYPATCYFPTTNEVTTNDESSSNSVNPSS